MSPPGFNTSDGAACPEEREQNEWRRTSASVAGPNKPLPLSCLNHVSRTCKSVSASTRFYEEVLGFRQVKRPGFSFDGAWLYNYGIGVHLIKGRGQSYIEKPKEINPLADHLSFQSDNLEIVEDALKAHGLKFVRQTVLEDGITVHQLFFHDPDNNMIEICNCEVLPVQHISCPLRRTQSQLMSSTASGAEMVDRDGDSSMSEDSSLHPLTPPRDE